MAYTSMTTRAAGYIVKAATDWNVMVANFTAIWVGTTAGDIDYYSSSTAKTRIGIGGAYSFLRSNGTIPAWGPLVAARQGGDTSIWTNPGTTTYTPTSTLIQVGYKSISFVSSTGSSTAISYPIAFTQRPAIFLTSETPYTLAYMWALGHNNDTVNGFDLNVKWSSAYTGTLSFGWMAIGA